VAPNLKYVLNLRNGASGIEKEMLMADAPLMMNGFFRFHLDHVVISHKFRQLKMHKRKKRAAGLTHTPYYSSRCRGSMKAVRCSFCRDDHHSRF